MRLIDADVSEEKFNELRKNRGWCGADLAVLDIVKGELIDEQPTAYDIEKTVDRVREICYQLSLDESQTELIVDEIKKGGVIRE